MVPKTKLQKKVVELSSKLSPITDKQKSWAFEKCFNKYAVRSRKTLYCLECGHSWKNESVLITALEGCTCPNCGSNLKMATSYQRILQYSSYMAILNTRGNMQAVRMFYLHKFMKKGQKAEYSAHEVMQHWIGLDGKITTMSKTVQGLSHYYDLWILQSNLEVRPGNHQNCPRYGIIPNVIYPERKVLPILKRNGFKGHMYDFAPHIFFSLIINDSYAETLLKAGQIELLKSHERRSHMTVTYWSSIKICMRNAYIVKDASMWFDYIELLVDFGKDINNAKYVCPENLKAVHDKLVRKKREIERKQEIEEMRKEIAAYEKKYAKNKGRFLDLIFKDGNLIVKPLESVEEFMIEGDELNHCVFANKYYEKADCLVLSAMIKDKRIETVELSLKDMKILQSRGMNNIASEYHDRIINLVQSNIKKIAARKLEKEAV